METDKTDFLSLALCGDIMTGRGIDQILPHAGDPRLHEDYVRDAWEYVRLAVRASGSIPFPVSFEYVWGDALAELRQAHLRIVNLETSITRSDDHWRGKGIHYRMNPRNIGCLSAARLDCCGLANNHVLDWGYAGLEETLRTLGGARIAHPGAGRDAAEAGAPAILEAAGGRGRVLVLAVGLPTSGIFGQWAASSSRPGVNLLDRLSPESATHIAQQVLQLTRRDDVTIVSIHWGGNWGHDIPPAQIAFAHRLIDEGIDVVHGHSSHHPKAIGIHRGRPILYGCGDFLNDYEGISGYEKYRGDLTALYRVKITREPQRSIEVTLVPYQLKRLQLVRANEKDARWLGEELRRESARFGVEVRLESDRTLSVRSA